MKRVAILMLAVVLTSACKKEKHTPDLTGTYTGLFNATPLHPTAQLGDPLPVQLIISGDTFKSGQSITYNPVGGGDVQISTMVVDFTNNQAFPDNTSINTAAVLHDNYSYTVEGDSLLLSKTALDVTYTYKFKKQ
jgi:hypothetical protein